MEKRLILFLVLSFVIMFFYPYLTKKLGNPPVNGAPKAPVSTLPSGRPDHSTALAEPSSLPESERDFVTVETDLLKIVISMNGGVIKTWELKKYSLGAKHPGELVQLVYQGADGIPPLSFTPDKIASTGPSYERYVPSATQIVLDAQHPTSDLFLNYENPATGETIKKSSPSIKGVIGSIWN